MEIEKLFKNLILIDFALLILIVISSIYQPNEFIEITKNLDKGILSNYANLTRILSLILFFLYILTLNLLYRFVFYARNLYFFVIIAGLLLNFFNGSVIYTSFGSLLDQIGGITSGAILILIFYSPVKENFNK